MMISTKSSFSKDSPLISQFFKAADTGNLAVLQIIRTHNQFNIDMRDDKGMTALMLAAAAGHLDVVRYLVEHEAATELQNTDGMTALMLAAENEHFEVVRYFEGNEDREQRLGYVDYDAYTEEEQKLILAAENGDLQTLKSFFEEGKKIEIRIEAGYKALACAVLKGDRAVVEYLYLNLKKEEDFQIFTLLLLAMAAGSGHLSVVEYFVENGVGVNHQENQNDDDDEEDDGPLICAARNGHLHVVQYLVENSAEINITNKDGCTALMLACEKGYLHVVRYLVEQGVQKDFKNKDGITALMAACEKGYLNVVRYLVEQGVDKDFKNNEGSTALMLACENGHLNVLKYLVEHGADKDFKNNEGCTALMLAAAAGHQDVVGYFVANGAGKDSNPVRKAKAADPVLFTNKTSLNQDAIFQPISASSSERKIPYSKSG